MPRRHSPPHLLVLLALLALPAAAAETPLPPPRPADLVPDVAVPVPLPQPVPLPLPVPLPPERPPELAAPAPAEPVPPPAVEAPPAIPEPPPRPAEFSAAAEVEEAACQARLGTLGVTFEARAPVSEGVCGAPHPLHVAVLPGGLALVPPITTRCLVVEALVQWSADVRVAATEHLKAQPKRLLTGGSYECRNRNHVSDAPLSEHALGNAVDVMGFAFEGHPDLPVLVVSEGTPEAAFLGGVRAKACAAFTTVLGPGSDPEHANHLHLDLRQRRNGYRICQ